MYKSQFIETYRNSNDKIRDNVVTIEDHDGLCHVYHAKDEKEASDIAQWFFAQDQYGDDACITKERNDFYFIEAW
jgi:hypothetical protein